MNIHDLKINKNALSINDLQKVKGGLSEPPPFGVETRSLSEPPPFGVETRSLSEPPPFGVEI